MRLLSELEDDFAELEALVVGPDAEKREQKAGRAPQRPRQLLERLERSIGQAHEVCAMFSRGFTAERSAKTDAGDAYSRWHPEMTKHDAATFTIRVYVVLLAAELEHFVRGLAMWRLTPLELARVRASPPANFPKKSADAVARRWLADHVKPSGRANTWASRMDLVFGVRLPTALRRAFRALIEWRHEFVHRNNPPTFIDWSEKPDLAEVMICWMFAAFGLGTMLVAQTTKR